MTVALIGQLGSKHAPLDRCAALANEPRLRRQLQGAIQTAADGERHSM
jgi:hypothetical protein